jgi:hypothetical protein
MRLQISARPDTLPPTQIHARIAPANRLLTAAEFHRLARQLFRQPDESMAVSNSTSAVVRADANIRGSSHGVVREDTSGSETGEQGERKDETAHGMVSKGRHDSP